MRFLLFYIWRSVVEYWQEAQVLHIAPLLAIGIGIGAGVSALGGLIDSWFGDKEPSKEEILDKVNALSDEARTALAEQLNVEKTELADAVTDAVAKLEVSTEAATAEMDTRVAGMRSDQKGYYEDAQADVDKQFSDAEKKLTNNLSTFRNQLIQQQPERRAEILSIYSVQNPAVQDYVKNLKAAYDQASNRVYGQVKRANMDETRRWKQQGITGGTIGRMVAGNQMARLSQAEQILTQKMNQVFAPQAQIAQMGMGVLGQAEAQQAAALRGAGQLGVTGALGLGQQRAGIAGALGGQYLGSQAGIAGAGIGATGDIATTGLRGVAGLGRSGVEGGAALGRAGLTGMTDIYGREIAGTGAAMPTGQPGDGFGELFTGAGTEFVRAGIEGLMAPEAPPVPT